ncbi:hypothetical protein EGR_05113 [Echinococcus granulosus]|uniref:Uncharacterized protein n=1 Tax=Echinococcus granulosus TaxID=6210 RepID=W6UNU1_ECHGR|nr:hypothetical protein EGR_05113 [Echinococcus granulosus]EUB59952.1 hypothetical protein EGR_05113 [Echinococcus granulosus]
MANGACCYSKILTAFIDDKKYGKCLKLTSRKQLLHPSSALVLIFFKKTQSSNLQPFIHSFKFFSKFSDIPVTLFCNFHSKNCGFIITIEQATKGGFLSQLLFRPSNLFPLGQIKFLRFFFKSLPTEKNKSKTPFLAIRSRGFCRILLQSTIKAGIHRFMKLGAQKGFFWLQRFFRESSNKLIDLLCASVANLSINLTLFKTRVVRYLFQMGNLNAKCQNK